MSAALIAQFALAALLALVAIVLHELAHGWAALALGDDTARRLGRPSPNPLRHVDRVGTILVPGVLLATQLATIGRVAFLFGWARPVPVDPRNLRLGGWRSPRRLMMLVALAGPAMNFALAWLAALALHLPALLDGVGPGGTLPGPGSLRQEAADVLEGMLPLFILYNLALGLFNLLPVPPLDGGRVVVGLLPEGLARVWARLERAGIALVMVGVFLLPALLAQAGYSFDPVRDALARLLPWAFDLVLRLAGSPALAQ